MRRVANLIAIGTAALLGMWVGPGAISPTSGALGGSPCNVDANTWVSCSFFNDPRCSGQIEAGYQDVHQTDGLRMEFNQANAYCMGAYCTQWFDDYNFNADCEPPS